MSSQLKPFIQDLLEVLESQSCATSSQDCTEILSAGIARVADKYGMNTMEVSRALMALVEGLPGQLCYWENVAWLRKTLKELEV